MAGTGRGRKIYISDEPVPDADLNEAGFEALTYVQIGRVGNTSAGGATTNFPTYSELLKPVADKQKGVTTPADLTIELRPVPTDTGQMALKAASLTNYSYAFKIEEGDAPDADTTNTIQYNRGVVGAAQDGFGGSDDFRTKTYTIGLQQLPVDVAQEAIP